MAIIPINDEYRIASDSKQWSVQSFNVNKNTGEESWTGFMFFGTLQSALNGLSDHLLRESDAVGMDQLMEQAQEISRMLEDAVKLPKEIQ